MVADWTGQVALVSGAGSARGIAITIADSVLAARRLSREDSEVLLVMPGPISSARPPAHLLR